MLNNNNYLTISYYKSLRYHKHIEILESQNISIKDFRFAKEPNDIFGLSDNLANYADDIYKIMSNKRIYM
jgi:hypothetical protein